MPYIVRFIGTEENVPAKRFEQRLSARDFARRMVEDGEADRAEVLSDTLELLESVGKRATDGEMKSAFEIAWKEAEERGDTTAQLKLLGL